MFSTSQEHKWDLNMSEKMMREECEGRAGQKIWEGSREREAFNEQ